MPWPFLPNCTATDGRTRTAGTSPHRRRLFIVVRVGCLGARCRTVLFAFRASAAARCSVGERALELLGEQSDPGRSMPCGRRKSPTKRRIAAGSEGAASSASSWRRARPSPFAGRTNPALTLEQVVEVERARLSIRVGARQHRGRRACRQSPPRAPRSCSTRPLRRCGGCTRGGPASRDSEVRITPARAVVEGAFSRAPAGPWLPASGTARRTSGPSSATSE